MTDLLGYHLTRVPEAESRVSGLRDAGGKLLCREPFLTLVCRDRCPPCAKAKETVQADAPSGPRLELLIVTMGDGLAERFCEAASYYPQRYPTWIYLREREIYVLEGDHPAAKIASWLTKILAP